MADVKDDHNLYSPLMEQHFFGGIRRSMTAGGSDRNFEYAPKPGYEHLPVVFVSWNTAIRFINWLGYGKPKGLQVLGVTEGNADFGSYDSGVEQPSRSDRARYWLPNCDEWVKAAFYEPKSRSYRNFASGNEVPAAAEAKQNAQTSANYYSRGWANPFPHLSSVYNYERSSSVYGTVNQGGNVMEWIENGKGAYRHARGGSLFMGLESLKRSYEDLELSDQALSTFGFRVAAAMDLAPSPDISLPRKVDNVQRNKPATPPAEFMSFVRIGQPQNEADIVTGTGAVGYEFEIGKYEISNAQYVEFLNAVAAHGDKYRLYLPAMSTGVLGGIDRSSSDSSERYTVKKGYENLPVAYVSWYSIARMANWLHFGSPTKVEGLGATEGTDVLGAYDTRLFPRADYAGAPPDQQPEHRNQGALYFIPTNNEWYKAAYFDPEKWGLRHYWNYPTRTDDPPLPLPGEGDTKSANYQVGDNLAVGPPHYLADVQTYSASASFFGTQQQGGNLWEWIEDWKSKGEGGCWRCNEWTRGLRAGSFSYNFIGLSIFNTDPGAPDEALYIYGARLARNLDNSGWQAPTLFSKAYQNVLNVIDGLSFKKKVLGLVIGLILSFFSGALLATIVRRSKQYKRR